MYSMSITPPDHCSYLWLFLDTSLPYPEPSGCLDRLWPVLSDHENPQRRRSKRDGKGLCSAAGRIRDDDDSDGDEGMDRPHLRMTGGEEMELEFSGTRSESLGNDS